MQIRNSRSRIQSLQSLNQLESARSVRDGKKEFVFFACEAHTFSRKTLKNKEPISQKAVESFVRKGPRTRPNHYNMYLLEDRVRFKPRHLALRHYAHRTVPYGNIKGAFSVVERPHWLVLGIWYPNKSHAKLESFYFPRTEDAERVKELLLNVKENEQNLLHGVQPIGLVSRRWTGSLSRGSSLTDLEPSEPGSRNTSIYSQQRESPKEEPRAKEPQQQQRPRQRQQTPSPTPTPQQREPKQLRQNGHPQTYQEFTYGPKPTDTLCSVATSPITPRHEFRFDNGHALARTPNDIEKETVMHHYAPVRVEIPHRQMREVRATSTPPYMRRPYQSPNYRERSEYAVNSSEAIYALYEEQPGSLIFINNTPSKGIHVAEDGPVFMFCQIEP